MEVMVCAVAGGWRCCLEWIAADSLPPVEPGGWTAPEVTPSVSSRGRRCDEGEGGTTRVTSSEPVPEVGTVSAEGKVRLRDGVADSLPSSFGLPEPFSKALREGSSSSMSWDLEVDLGEAQGMRTAMRESQKEDLTFFLVTTGELALVREEEDCWAAVAGAVAVFVVPTGC